MNMTSRRIMRHLSSHSGISEFELEKRIAMYDRTAAPGREFHQLVNAQPAYLAPDAIARTLQVALREYLWK